VVIEELTMLMEGEAVLANGSRIEQGECAGTIIDYLMVARVSYIPVRNPLPRRNT
jgi:hypothetical protein